VEVVSPASGFWAAIEHLSISGGGQEVSLVGAPPKPLRILELVENETDPPRIEHGPMSDNEGSRWMSVPGLDAIDDDALMESVGRPIAPR